jgi:hypothetical protein
MDLNSDEFRIFHFKVRPDPDGQIALSKHQHGSLSHIARCPVITRLPPHSLVESLFKYYLVFCCEQGNAV